MSRFRYSKFVPSPLDEIDLEELVDQLKDFFLQSGFYSRFFPGSSGQGEADLNQFLRALAEALADNPLVPEEWQEELEAFSRGDGEEETELSPEVEEFLQKLIQRLIEEGYLQPVSQSEGGARSEGEGRIDSEKGQVRFQLTKKGVDFLGFKTLQSLLGSLGRSSIGVHPTPALATGVEADSQSRPYRFGDTLNLDVSGTLLNAIRRQGPEVPIELDYQDLRVQQSEYQSSCASVVMLDCSHSMILYGEDRFTPAKKVALALAHLIRTRFPGDTVRFLLFHDSAEEVPLAKLAGVRVGPFHTNTCEGLRLARKMLLDQKKDMRQIIMITDGKPSALTLPDGRIYKNPFGLDPMILEKTFEEVARCRRSGIMINTFMLARDPYLVDFVKRVSEICKGKAYFATTVTLARYILMDFMTKKTTVH